DSYSYNVTPPKDDSPFFFEYHFLNALGLPKLNNLRGAGAGITLYVILVEALVLSLLAIFLPLWVFQKNGLNFQSKWKFVTYFSCLGLGFMVVEIALIQKFVLFLGNPLYSLPVVLASLMVSAGLGSGFSARLNLSFSQKVLVFGSLLIGALTLYL